MEDDLEAAVKDLSDRAARARSAAVILAIVGAVVSVPSLLAFGNGCLSAPELGDTVAGTTGVIWALAGLAMIFAAFTVQQQQMLLQRRDLAVTQAELVESRKEMKAQTEVFSAQNAAIVSQRFESSFFQLLDAHEAFARDLTFMEGKTGFSGRAVFVRVYENMYQRTVVNRMYPADFTLEKAVAVYNELYRELDSVLGPYFRSLYQIVSWIDSSSHDHLDESARRRYSNILRARLSADELLVFFYNLGSAQGSGFVPLVAKYNLLKHLPRQRLLRTEHWAMVFPADGAA